MRSWRKLHSNLIFSERAPLLSDSAMTLFCLLVVVQDDEGYYPWTPQAVRSFTISRPWSFEQTTEFANELVAAGMAFWDEGAAGIVLHRGEELNGLPRKYSAVLSYRKRPIDTNETPLDALGTEADRRLPLADRRLPSDKDPDRDEEEDPEKSHQDLPVHITDDIWDDSRRRNWKLFGCRIHCSIWRLRLRNASPGTEARGSTFAIRGPHSLDGLSAPAHQTERFRPPRPTIPDCPGTNHCGRSRRWRLRRRLRHCGSGARICSKPA